jgi:hypothetical protein
MKKIVTLALVLVTLGANAQLVYLGDDDRQKGFDDGYFINRGTTGFVTMGGLQYFISPNGKLMQTDGTEKNTKVITSFAPESIPYLKATNKYVYFAYDGNDGAVKRLYRYSPSSGLNRVTNPLDNNADFMLNANVINNKFMADEIFTSYEKDYLLIRKFTKDVFYIYIIKDNNDNAKVYLVESKQLDSRNVQTPIGVNTTIEAHKSDIYWNGQMAKNKVYETIVVSYQQTKEDSYKYKFKSNFILKDIGMYIYPGFARTKENNYILIRTEDKEAKQKNFRLFYCKDTSLASFATKLNLPFDDATTQVIDGNIYISCKSELHVFNEKTSSYRKIFTKNDAQSGWYNIAPNQQFLKVGNYFMCSENYKPFIHNSNTNVTEPVLAEGTYQDNYFYLNKPLYFAGKNSFYFSTKVNGAAVFSRYNPITKAYSPIQFPDTKKERFEKIRAVFQDSTCSKKFIFLTSYKGKKDKPVYKMFMYNEDGETLPTTAAILTFNTSNVVTIPNKEQIAVTKSIDVKTFDKKQFLTQLAKILNNQSNQFEDIKGEALPNGTFYEYKSLAKLDGFGGEKIMDFKKSSSLIRFQAETSSIKGKNNGLEILNMLDAEIQKLIAGNNIKREIDVDIKTRKVIQYLNTDGNKLLQLDLYCGGDASNLEEAIFTITIRADKVAR